MHTQISGPRKDTAAAEMTNSTLTGSVCICEAATCVITNNPVMSKDSCCVLVCVCERVYYFKSQCGYTSSWQMSHACRWSPLRLPLNLCSKLERNPGGLAGLCAQLTHLHLQRFKNRCPGSPPPTLYTPPVKPALPGEPVPELLIQSK